jgi:hypothetical protein
MAATLSSLTGDTGHKGKTRMPGTSFAEAVKSAAAEASKPIRHDGLVVAERGRIAEGNAEEFKLR